MGKMTANYKSIDEYLGLIPEKDREALEKLRKTIISIVPEAVEVISYGIPTFNYKGKHLVGFGAAKNHCSFYVMSSATIAAHMDKLKSYDTSTGTIRFPVDKPLPAALVKTLIKARIKENEAKGKKK